MIATVLAATLAAAPGPAQGPAPGPAQGTAVAHAPAEAALLRTAFPDFDEGSGWLGHGEGTLVDRSSACAASGQCVLAVAASDGRPGGTPAPGHAWSTLFAFRPAGGGWRELGHAAGPVIAATGHWRVGVSVQAGADGLFVSLETSTSGGEDGDVTARHLWSWDGSRFLPVLSAATGKVGTTETEASYALCADRPADRPSWELRTREREGRGKWTEARVRVVWNGQAWVERPPERPCGERGGPVAVAAAAAAVSVKSASASKTATANGKAPPHGPALAIDGNRQTAWVAGGKRGGVGEWLQLDFAAPTVLGSLQLLGTCPGPDWKAGPRLKKVRLRFEDGPAQDEALADVQSAQAILVARKTPARWVRIELLDLYRGSKRQEACISEVTPQGR